MHLRFAPLALAVIVAAASSASAATLYNNSYAGSNVANNKFSPADTTSQHFALSKVVVGPAGWAIDSLSSYHSYAGNLSNLTFQGAHLHIVPDADLATFDPTSTADVETVTAVSLATPSFFSAGLAELTVDPAADIELTQGTYWIGVTPIVDNVGGVGPGSSVLQFGRRGTLTSELAQYAVEPSATIGTSTTPTARGVWETRGDSLALVINGAKIPEPSTVALVSIAGLTGLAVMRRRRS